MVPTMSPTTAACDETTPANSPPSGPQRTAIGWLTLHALCLSLCGLAWIADEPAYRIMNGWYNGPEPLNGEVHQLILSLAMYGQNLGIALSLALILILDVRHRGRAFILAMVLIIAGLGSSATKGIIGRERPVEAGGKTNFHGLLYGLTHSRNQSFPSGHTATAFAMSYCLCRLYPQSSGLVWLLACAVGFNRVITVRHFVSDVVAGAWFGYAVAALVYRWAWLRKMAAHLDDMLVPGKRQWAWRWRGLPRLPIRRLLASFWLLFLVSLTLHWAGNGAIALWDRDEPRFATATREMLAGGNWIVPTFNGDLRPDKPILIYWLMGLTYRLFGDNPFAARAISGLAGALACVAIGRVGAKMFDRRVGLLAGWILALSPMLIIESKLATVDALLLFLLVLVFGCLWSLYQGPAGKRTALSLWLLLGLAVLTKGPVALAIPAVALAGFCAVRREWGWLARLQPRGGMLLLLGIVLPWCVAVQWQTGGTFLEQAVGRHVVLRALQPLENHTGFPGYYVVTLFGMMAPWAWLLPWLIREYWSDWRADPRLAWLASWALGTLVFFELVRTKLIHYYLPAYPALALLLAAGLVGRFRGRPRGLFQLKAWIVPCYMVCWGAVGLLGALAACAFLPGELAGPVVMTLTLATGGALLAGELLRRRRFVRGFVVLAGTTAAWIIVLDEQVLPPLSRQRLAVQVAERVRQRGWQRELGLWLYRDPSIIYNLETQIPIVDPMRSEPVFRDSIALAAAQGRFICPMTPEQVDLMARDECLKLEVLETIVDHSPSLKTRAIHLVAVRLADQLAMKPGVINGARRRSADRLPASTAEQSGPSARPALTVPFSFFSGHWTLNALAPPARYRDLQ